MLPITSQFLLLHLEKNHLVWRPGLISLQSQSHGREYYPLSSKANKKRGCHNLFNFQLDLCAIHQPFIGAPHSLVLLSDFRDVE